MSQKYFYITNETDMASIPIPREWENYIIFPFFFEEPTP